MIKEYRIYAILSFAFLINCAGHNFAAGKMTEKVVPCSPGAPSPSHKVSTSTRPPKASAIEETIDRPSPEDPFP